MKRVIKLAIQTLLVMLGSVFLLADSPPFPAFGLTLLVTFVFGFRRLHIYSYLNLFIISLVLAYVIVTDPALLMQLRPSMWIRLVIIVPGLWLLFRNYRSNSENREKSEGSIPSIDTNE